MSSSNSEEQTPWVSRFKFGKASSVVPKKEETAPILKVEDNRSAAVVEKLNEIKEDIESTVDEPTFSVNERPVFKRREQPSSSSTHHHHNHNTSSTTRPADRPSTRIKIDKAACQRLLSAGLRPSPIVRIKQKQPVVSEFAVKEDIQHDKKSSEQSSSSNVDTTDDFSSFIECADWKTSSKATSSPAAKGNKEYETATSSSKTVTIPENVSKKSVLGNELPIVLSSMSIGTTTATIAEKIDSLGIQNPIQSSKIEIKKSGNEFDAFFGGEHDWLPSEDQKTLKSNKVKNELPTSPSNEIEPELKSASNTSGSKSGSEKSISTSSQPAPKSNPINTTSEFDDFFGGINDWDTSKQEVSKSNLQKELPTSPPNEIEQESKSASNTAETKSGSEKSISTSSQPAPKSNPINTTSEFDDFFGGINDWDTSKQEVSQSNLQNELPTSPPNKIEQELELPCNTSEVEAVLKEPISTSSQPAPKSNPINTTSEFDDFFEGTNDWDTSKKVTAENNLQNELPTSSSNKNEQESEHSSNTSEIKSGSEKSISTSSQPAPKSNPINTTSEFDDFFGGINDWDTSKQEVSESNLQNELPTSPLNEIEQKSELPSNTSEVEAVLKKPISTSSQPVIESTPTNKISEFDDFFGGTNDWDTSKQVTAEKNLQNDLPTSPPNKIEQESELPCNTSEVEAVSEELSDERFVSDQGVDDSFSESNAENENPASSKSVEKNSETHEAEAKLKKPKTVKRPKQAIKATSDEFDEFFKIPNDWCPSNQEESSGSASDSTVVEENSPSPSDEYAERAELVETHHHGQRRQNSRNLPLTKSVAHRHNASFRNSARNVHVHSTGLRHQKYGVSTKMRPPEKQTSKTEELVRGDKICIKIVKSGVVKTLWVDSQVVLPERTAVRIGKNEDGEETILPSAMEILRRMAPTLSNPSGTPFYTLLDEEQRSEGFSQKESCICFSGLSNTDSFIPKLINRLKIVANITSLVYDNDEIRRSDVNEILAEQHVYSNSDAFPYYNDFEKLRKDSFALVFSQTEGTIVEFKFRSKSMPLLRPVIIDGYSIHHSFDAMVYPEHPDLQLKAFLQVKLFVEILMFFTLDGKRATLYLPEMYDVEDLSKVVDDVFAFESLVRLGLIKFLKTKRGVTYAETLERMALARQASLVVDTSEHAPLTGENYKIDPLYYGYHGPPNTRHFNMNTMEIPEEYMDCDTEVDLKNSFSDQKVFESSVSIQTKLEDQLYLGEQTTYLCAFLRFGDYNNILLWLWKIKLIFEITNTHKENEDDEFFLPEFRKENMEKIGEWLKEMEKTKRVPDDMPKSFIWPTDYVNTSEFRRN